MNNVYIVQDSPGKNLLPAKEFGDLRVMLTGSESVEEAVRKLTSKLLDFKTTDFLLLVGNPIFISIAFHITAELQNGRFNLLIWDREHYKYNLETINL